MSHEITAPTEAPSQPGIYQLDEEVYHQGPGISKTGLWTIHKRRPFHYRYGERKETEAMKLGSADHCAVLEPNLFDKRYACGPKARGNSKEWKTAETIANESGRELLKPADYDNVLRLRDELYRDATIRQLLTDGAPAIEQSAYWIDPETKELCRVRPDVYNYKLRLMADLKSIEDAGLDNWEKSITTYGYNLQDFMYGDGWQQAGGGDVDGFAFIAVEKKAPFAHALYEIDEPSIVEAEAVFNLSMANYHRCMNWEREAREEFAAGKSTAKTVAELDLLVRASCWPAYDKTVQKSGLKPWGFTLTKKEP